MSERVEFEAWAVTAHPSATFGLVTYGHIPYLHERLYRAEAEAYYQGSPSKVVRVRVTVEIIEPADERGAD